jgi:hypothetical protein
MRIDKRLREIPPHKEGAANHEKIRALQVDRHGCAIQTLHDHYMLTVTLA